MAAGFLRFGAEDGVAAAHVGHHGMRAAGGVAQGDAVLLAGAAAIAIAGAGGKEAAEDAVLGVEDGQMLVGDGFDPACARAARQLGDLRGVQIVRRREALEAELEKLRGGDGVGGVEAEIADQFAMFAVAQRMQQAGWSAPGSGSRSSAGNRRCAPRRA